MSVYVDGCAIAFRRMKTSHMIADSLEELHAMAAAIGMKREWFQVAPPASFPHYDVSQTKRGMAIVRGAIPCDRNTFVAHVRRLRPVFGVYGPGNPAPKASP